MDIDIGHLQRWIGGTRESRDEISPRLANCLAAVLDETPALAAGDAAPAGIHWCLSPEIAPMSGLGPDGHPARGDFLPPVPLPRRMWAGGELAFLGEFRVGDVVTRRSRIADVALKEGRSGALCFVTVTHEYHTPRGLTLRERHDIVYRPVQTAAATGKTPAPPALPARTAGHDVAASPVLLSRYSAVTFNGHRIHYDRDYCQTEEGYPGLVVHGPLQATFLLRLACRMGGGRLPARFDFRGTAPLFDGGTFSVNAAPGGPEAGGPEAGGPERDGGELQLWVQDAAGGVTMQARARPAAAA